MTAIRAYYIFIFLSISLLAKSYGGKMDCGEAFSTTFMSALSSDEYPFENVFGWNIPDLIFSPFGRVCVKGKKRGKEK